jgi:Ca2+/Na+ antiporter
VIVHLLFSVFFFGSGVWFAILAFSKSVHIRIMQSSTFFSMIVFILVGHILSIFFSREIEIQFWHVATLVVSILLYIVVLIIVRREYFIQGISEEDFVEYLIDFLDEQKFCYRISEKSMIPDISPDVPMKAFYIVLTKTAYIRTSTKSLLRLSKEYFISRMKDAFVPKVSYERVLFAFISVLLLLYAFYFARYV